MLNEMPTCLLTMHAAGTLEGAVRPLIAEVVSPDDGSRHPPAGPVLALRTRRSLPHRIGSGGADRRAGHRPRTGRTTRARRACRPAGGDVRLGVSGQPARRCRPDAGRNARRSAGSTTSPSCPASTRNWRRPRCGAARPTYPSGTPTHDGVVGVWYGKGPGLDRATDALRHANMYGANPRGGMLLLVGDDPASKSSTVPAVSERSLAALGIPVLFPRNAREIVTMAMHGVAMSRASGCVVALKIVADVADGAWSVDAQRRRRRHRRSRSPLGRKAVRLPAAADGRACRQPGRRGRPLRTPCRGRARLRCRQRARRHRARSAPRDASGSPPRERHSTRCGRPWPTSAPTTSRCTTPVIRLLRIGMPTPLGPDTVDVLRRRARGDPRRRGQDRVRRDPGARNPLRPSRCAADHRQEGRRGSAADPRRR